MHFLRVICLIIYITFLGFGTAQAALNLNANPADGGNTLRLGRVDDELEVTKAVKLRISSSDGKQYQVFQRLEETLRNERQNTLDHHALKAYAVSGSNSAGTLYAQQNEPLSLTDQLLFTSSPDGQSDTLTIVYAVDPQRLNVSGNFMGRIAYTVRALGGSGQDQVFLNVYLEASGQLKVEITPATSRTGIRLEHTPRSDKDDDVRVSFSGNGSADIRIYQEVRQFPADDLGQEIDGEVFEFSTASARGEIYHIAPEKAGRKKVLIYKSNENEDDFHVHFGLNHESLAALKAGVYRGKIILTVESSQGTNDFPLDVEIKVDPIFEVSVTLPPGGIKFPRILPSDPPQEHEVTVTVKTNLGKPYMVIHSMATPLINAKGDEIKAGHFMMKMELIGNSSGKISAGDFVPVQTGETPVFMSDAKGSPAEFKVLYRLRSYPDIAAGDYAAPIVFSLGEM